MRSILAALRCRFWSILGAWMLLALWLFPTASWAHDWSAGIARVNITPEKPMWMSGYGARDRPAEGKQTDLWGKALLLADPQGARLLLITVDLCGIDRDFSLAVRQAICEKHRMQLKDVAINCSHTHSGPVVGGNLASMYFLDASQQALVDEYTAKLKQQLIDLASAAESTLTPCELFHGQGKATFAVNRRTNAEAKVPEIRAAGELKGPVDHAVPVLCVQDTDGSIRCLVTGYACHATVLPFYLWSGDWPAYAQQLLEQNHPGAQAMFVAGCGGDQNPLPRRTVELAAEYGHRLAEAVESTLEQPMQEITGALRADYQEIDLALDRLPTREQIAQDAAASDKYVSSRAKRLLAQIDSGKPLQQTYPYPIQVWQLGKQLTWVTLGGEVVVDFALRIKAENHSRVWVSGYTNDVMAYIPSRRVLTEGGYEGAGAMVYYGLPSPWSPDVEETIMRQVKQGIEATR